MSMAKSIYASFSLTSKVQLVNSPLCFYALAIKIILLITVNRTPPVHYTLAKLKEKIVLRIAIAKKENGIGTAGDERNRIETEKSN